MALLRNLQVLELSGLRLDQPLTCCGRLNHRDALLASETRFIAAQRAIQTAIDRRVDLVVAHSGVLSETCAGGRAPWFWARLVESCSEHGIPVVWAESCHNVWAERFVSLPASLSRLAPGQECRVMTRAGAVLFSTGRSVSPVWQEDIQATIGLDFGRTQPLDRESCDLILRPLTQFSDRVEDFVATTQDRDTPALAKLHSLRLDRANSSEQLSQTPVGFMKLTCSWSANLSASNLVEGLGEEVDAAAGRYFASQPQTQLLLLDLTVAGHGPVWDSLWDVKRRATLAEDINRRTRHPGCHVRSIHAMADRVEATRSCPLTPTVDAIWVDQTARHAHGVRTLAEIAPDAIALGDWSRGLSIPVDHPLAPEVRHACLHLLRSAS